MVYIIYNEYTLIIKASGFTPLRMFSTKWPRSVQVFFETLKNTKYVYDYQ